MRGLFRIITSGAATAIGWLGGVWLWDNYLKDKANNLKTRLEQRKGS